jgi:hypothetical protein
MYVIANLETRSVLTHRDGSRIVYGSEELAKQHCTTAEEMTNDPHAVLHLLDRVAGYLPRKPAPWFKPTR